MNFFLVCLIIIGLGYLVKNKNLLQVLHDIELANEKALKDKTLISMINKELFISKNPLKLALKLFALPIFLLIIWILAMVSYSFIPSFNTGFGWVLIFCLFGILGLFGICIIIYIILLIVLYFIKSKEKQNSSLHILKDKK